jgi:hypothetical protein
MVTYVYTPNVPQGNQQIALTQGPILTNFTYLSTYVGQEHNFDVTGNTPMFHEQCSMPSQSALAAYPIDGTTGVYYVTTPPATTLNLAEFYDGTLNYNLNLIRAWVNFDGTSVSPCTKRASFNVSNVIKNFPGNYTIQFTNNIPTENYVTLISGMGNNSLYQISGCVYGDPTYGNSIKVGSVTINTTYNGISNVDPIMVSVAILGF